MSAVAPASEWAPMFAYYSGTSVPKFTDVQIEMLAMQGRERNFCCLCDTPVTKKFDAHVRQHMRDLKEWRKQRSHNIEVERKKRLAESQRLKQEGASVYDD